MIRIPFAAAAVSSLLILGVAGPALARPASWAMTCGQARTLVQSQGAVVINFSPTVYERVVSAANFCFPGQTLRPEFAPTRDVRQCFIGYSCSNEEYEWDR